MSSRRRISVLCALALAAAALAGCVWSDSPVEPAACKDVHFNATIANADGAATLLKVLVTSDGDPYTYTLFQPGGAPTASIGMTVNFRYATVGMHTVKIVVADQTATPSRYRVTGDFSQQTCTAQSSQRSSGPLEAKTAMLATGEAISYDFQF